MLLFWMRKISDPCLPLLAVLLSFGCGGATEEPPPEGPAASFPEVTYDFGEVIQGTRVEHVFIVENRGSEDLRIELLEASEALSVSMPETVRPREQGGVEIAFETHGLSGSGNLKVELKTNDPEKPTQTLVIRGRLTSLIEIQPQNRVYFFDVIRGQTPHKDLELINHQDRPLTVLEVKSGTPRYFETALETLEAGQRYKLTLKLASDAPRGNRQERILVVTDSPDLPEIPIYPRAAIREVVDAKPDRVHFSTMTFESLRQEGLTERHLRVSKHQGQDFKLLDVSADVSFVEAEATEETPGQAYIVTVRIDAEKAVRGEIAGTLRIRTNDSDFPELKLPITGKIL